MRAEATAFAPGHVTGFFHIVDEAPDPAQVGSRGAGFSVDRGATSRVLVDDEGVPGCTVLVNGEPSDAATTRRAVDLLASKNDLHLRVEQRMDLPERQGFGMSAAGALSATLAVAEALGRPRREAVWAAHSAEVLQRTGLGDVVGASLGGFEVRSAAGLEPHGRIRPWKPEAPPGGVVLAVVADSVPTQRVLADPARRGEINRIGAELVDAFEAEARLGRFVDLSRRFALEARLASAPVLAAWDAVDDVGRAAQCQLGGSVFAFGPAPELERRLRDVASAVYVVGIDARGARVTSPRRVLA